jgi:ubiquinone/menaquinone biosynthesis C-methylase UbiE
MNSMPSLPTLKDLWTKSPGYRQCYQTSDDIDMAIALLDLAGATRLVDVGCGNGAFAIAAARRYPACRVRAFDALESAVAHCRAAGADLLQTNLTVDVAWADSLPLGDECCDRALMRSVLHHIADPMPVYRELARVLRPAGRLVLQAPCNFWEPEFGDVLSEIVFRTDDSHRRYFYRPADVVSALRRTGFETSEPECWTYTFPFLDEHQAEIVRQHGAAERLHLRAVEPGTWSIENYWVRLVATKLPQ